MKKSRLLILLALLLAVLSTFFLYQYVESLRKEPEVKVEYGTVIVAEANIPELVKISEEMIASKSVPVEAIHPDAARVPTDLIGLTSKSEILNGEQILKTKVATVEAELSLAYQIPENMRAIVVPIASEVTGLAGYLEIGDHVDMVVTYSNRPGPGTPPDPNQEPEVDSEEDPEVTTPVAPEFDEVIEGYVETITQFQNIEVLALGVKGALNEAGQPVESQGVPSSVVLLVTPEQAEVVSYMLGAGSFQMTLRNPVDGLKVPLDHFGTDNFNDWRNR